MIDSVKNKRKGFVLKDLISEILFEEPDYKVRYFGRQVKREDGKWGSNVSHIVSFKNVLFMLIELNNVVGSPILKSNIDARLLKRYRKCEEMLGTDAVRVAILGGVPTTKTLANLLYNNQINAILIPGLAVDEVIEDSLKDFIRVSLRKIFDSATYWDIYEYPSEPFDKNDYIKG